MRDFSMNKKIFYLFLILFLGSFNMDLFAWGEGWNYPKQKDNSYYGDPEVVDQFHSDKFSNEQRQAMLDWLDQHGLKSQASMKGAITALEKGGIDSLVTNATDTLLSEMDRRRFQEKFGVALSDGLVKGLSKNLENSEVMADLTKSINKSVKQMGDEISADFDRSLGKDSKLGQNTKETISYYADLVNGAYNSAVLGNMAKTGIVAVAITAALYSVPFAVRTVERQMTRPKLIIESSKLTVLEKLQTPFFGAENKKPMEKMVFSSSLKKYLDDIVAIVSKSYEKIKAGKTNIKYRNLMLYGPPGTGKTMFAKELARCSGLEFAYMSGSSFSKFKEGEAIEALDELFAWAKKCNGLILFIDEAETF